MRFLDEPPIIYSEDVWYDLTDGGYIRPEDFLIQEDAEQVLKAIRLVEAFIFEAEARGYFGGEE